MDRTDRAILDYLIAGSRISYAEIGRLLGLSRVSVRERVQALMEKGVIERFTVILNPEPLGLNLSAFFDVAVEPHHLIEVGQRLSGLQEVESVYLMTGASALHVHALLRDQDHLTAFLRDQVYPTEGILSVKTHIILKRFKERRGGCRI